jgi:hypothetical protein
MNADQFIAACEALSKQGWKADTLSNLVVLRHSKLDASHCDPLTAVCMEHFGVQHDFVWENREDGEFDWTTSARLLGLPYELVDLIINISSHTDNSLTIRLVNALFGTEGPAILRSITLRPNAL